MYFVTRRFKIGGKYLKKLNDYEKGFIEAFLDTDGGIYLAKGKHIKQGVVVTFFNNNRKLLEKVVKILDLKDPVFVEKKNKNISYELRIRQVAIVKPLLEQITLVIKEKRRKIALELLLFGNQALNVHKRTIQYKETIQRLIDLFYT